MVTAALDTSILVRLLVEGDASTKKFIRERLRDGSLLFVPITVALELEWVLRSRFAFDRSIVAKTLSQLLSSAELSFGAEGALETALAWYGQGTADFSDCVHVALAHAAGEVPLWTFDKAAARLDGARLLLA